MAVLESTDSLPKLNDHPAATHKTDVAKFREREPARNYADESREPASVTEGLFGRVVEINSQESGTHVIKFDDATVFTDAGIDSLLSLMISSRISGELHLQAATDNMLFTTRNTIRDLRHLLAPTDNATTTISAIIRELDGPKIRIASIGSSVASIRSPARHGGEETQSQQIETPDTSSDDIFLRTIKVSLATSTSDIRDPPKSTTDMSKDIISIH